MIAQALQDPGVYGVIQSGDHKDRTCVVKWIKLNATSDDVEVSQEARAQMEIIQILFPVLVVQVPKHC